MIAMQDGARPYEIADVVHQAGYGSNLNESSRGIRALVFVGLPFSFSLAMSLCGSFPK